MVKLKKIRDKLSLMYLVGGCRYIGNYDFGSACYGRHNLEPVFHHHERCIRTDCCHQHHRCRDRCGNSIGRPNGIPKPACR